MKVYIAGKFSSRQRLVPYKLRLIEMGYEVSSTWLDYDEAVWPDNPSLALDMHVNEDAADRDTREVAEADIFILDNLDEISGGRYVELGMARLGYKYIFIVGPVRCVFDTKHARFESWPELLEFIGDVGK